MLWKVKYWHQGAFKLTMRTSWGYLVTSAFFVNVRKAKTPPTPHVRICSHLVDPPSPPYCERNMYTAP